MIRNDDDLAKSPAHRVALDCVEAGIRAAHPERTVEAAVGVEGSTLHVGDEAFDLDQYDEVRVVGAGNAAGQVALALERVLGDRIDGGAVVTDDPAETDRIDVLPGDHPLPTQRGVESTRTVQQAAEDAGADALLLAVVAGGGSALLAAPATGIELDDLRATTDALLASGATIDEINAVRKHLSAVKGGLLARRAAPATTVGLVLSDVVGDDLSVIASGPLTPDPSTYGDALTVVDQYGLDLPDAVTDHLRRGDAGDLPETPDEGDAAFDRTTTHVIASGFTALSAAAEVATERGYDATVLSSRVRGEAREAAKTHVAIGEEVLVTGNPVEPPAVLLSGGETTVTVRGDGEGGPNSEFALSSALELRDEGIVVASVDTDGIDGATGVAGAIVDRGTVAGRRDEAAKALANNDACAPLEEAETLIETGKTGTNVNDLRVLVVDEH